MRVLALPGKADPDKFIREQGSDAYIKLLKEAPPYVDYLIARARQMDLSTGEGKLRAVNFLMPYVQKIPNRILRSEWATRIAQQLRLDEPVLRAALSKAAAERRSEVKTQPQLIGRAAKPVRAPPDSHAGRSRGFSPRDLRKELQQEQLYQGLETEKVFAALILANLSGQAGTIQATEIAAVLEDRDRRLLYEILFEESSELTWEEAESCLEALQHCGAPSANWPTFSAASRPIPRPRNAQPADPQAGADESKRLAEGCAPANRARNRPPPDRPLRGSRLPHVFHQLNR